MKHYIITIKSFFKQRKFPLIIQSSFLVLILSAVQVTVADISTTLKTSVISGIESSILPSTVYSYGEYLLLPQGLNTFRDEFKTQVARLSTPRAVKVKTETKSTLTLMGTASPTKTIKAKTNPPYKTRCQFPFEGETIDWYVWNMQSHDFYEAKRNMRDMYEQLTCVPANRFNDIALAFYFADMHVGQQLDEKRQNELREIIAPLGFLIFEMGNEMTRIILHRWIQQNQADWIESLDKPDSWLNRIGLAVSAGSNLVFLKQSRIREVLQSAHSPAWEDGACAVSDMRYIDDLSDSAVPNGMFCNNTCMSEAITNASLDVSDELKAMYVHPEVQQMCTEIKNGKAQLKSATHPLAKCLAELLTPTKDRIKACMSERRQNNINDLLKPKWKTTLVSNSCWVSDLPSKRHKRNIKDMFDDLIALQATINQQSIDIANTSGQLHQMQAEVSVWTIERQEERDELQESLVQMEDQFNQSLKRRSDIEDEIDKELEGRPDDDDTQCPPDDINCEQCGVQDEREQEFMECITGDILPKDIDDYTKDDLPGTGGIPDPKIADWAPHNAPDFTEQLLGIKQCQLEVFGEDTENCERVLRCPDGQEVVDCQCTPVSEAGYSEESLDDLMEQRCAEHIDCSDEDDDCSCGSPFDDDDFGGGDGPFPGPPVERAYMR